MLALAAALACAVALARPEHQKVAAALALMLAVNCGAIAPVLSPERAYLLFPAADLWIVLTVLCGVDWRASLAAVLGGWLLAGETYGVETPTCAHALAGAAALGAILFGGDGGSPSPGTSAETPEAAAATILGLSDLAALYPLARPRELWDETAKPQSLATWTVLSALEVYWIYRLYRRPPPPSGGDVATPVAEQDHRKCTDRAEPDYTRDA